MNKIEKSKTKMKIVKVGSKYKIRKGWWIFGYFMKESIGNSGSIFRKRKDLEFDFYGEAKMKVDEIKSHQ